MQTQRIRAKPVARPLNSNAIDKCSALKTCCGFGSVTPTKRFSNVIELDFILDHIRQIFAGVIVFSCQRLRQEDGMGRWAAKVFNLATLAGVAFEAILYFNHGIHSR